MYSAALPIFRVLSLGSRVCWLGYCKDSRDVRGLGCRVLGYLKEGSISKDRSTPRRDCAVAPEQTAMRAIV